MKEISTQVAGMAQTIIELFVKLTKVHMLKNIFVTTRKLYVI